MKLIDCLLLGDMSTFSDWEPMLAKKSWGFLLLVILGVGLRIGFTLAADSREYTFHSGGSDAVVYVLLAENIISHKGLTYAGEPSAFRPPGYPLLLAGFMEAFGQHYITAMRWMQFVVGLLTAGLCAKISRRLFNLEAARAAAILGLFMPTLIFSTDQLLTECLAAFLTALFLLFLVKQQPNGDARSAWGLGIAAGLESLIRFNAAALPFFALWAVVRSSQKRLLVLRAAAVLLLPLLIVLPWFIRNEIVFHGQVLYSTHGGPNAVEGVVNPQGRTQLGDTEKLKAAMGWCIQDLETNDLRRLALPSEVQLNQHAMQAVPHLWIARGWSAIPLVARKISDFWLSADQLLDTKSLPIRERWFRTVGVLAYVAVLALAVAGLYRLKKTRPEMATTFLIYAVGLTTMHLLVVMNTRLRIPLMEPLVVVLAGGGWARSVTFLQRVPGAGAEATSRGLVKVEGLSTT
jgi:4-amino-4-deoxy-L-arabinose transferase-like glycosyltransferase